MLSAVYGNKFTFTFSQKLSIDSQMIVGCPMDSCASANHISTRYRKERKEQRH
jgi:hypothetical protein